MGDFTKKDKQIIERGNTHELIQLNGSAKRYKWGPAGPGILEEEMIVEIVKILEMKPGIISRHVFIIEEGGKPGDDETNNEKEIQLFDE